MSRIASWGHWVVAAFLGAEGDHRVVVRALGLIHSARVGEPAESLVAKGFGQAVSLVLLLLIIRGVLTWANWTRTLLVIYFGFSCLVFTATVVFGGVREFEAPDMLNLIVAATAFAWLLLPSVRAAYLNEGLA